MTMPTQEISVSLGGGRTLKGRVLDNASSPVPGLRILAVPKGTGAYPEYRACLKAERNGGLLTGSGRTDRRGEFKIHALVDGEYDLYAGWLEGTSQKKERSSYAAQKKLWVQGNRQEEAQLGTLLETYSFKQSSFSPSLVYPCQRIEIQYKETATAPLRHHFALKKFNEDEPGYWDTANNPILVDGLAIYPIKPLQEYRLIWNQPGVRYQDWDINAPWGKQLIEVKMAASSSNSPVNLTLRVLDPDGKPCKREPLISILAPGSREVIEESFYSGMMSLNHVEDSQWSTVLPPGRILVRVHDTSLGGCVPSSPLQRPAHLPAERELALKEGFEGLIEIRMKSAGLLNFRSLAKPSGPASEDFSTYLDSLGSYGETTQLARDQFGAAEVVLLNSFGKQVPEVLFEVLKGASMPQKWVARGWDINCMAPLAPGTYALIVTREGDVIFEQQVLIQKGQETTVWW